MLDVFLLQLKPPQGNPVVQVLPSPHPIVAISAEYEPLIGDVDNFILVLADQEEFT